MKAVCTDADAQAGHAPASEFAGGVVRPYPESPPRYTAIRDALEAVRWVQIVDATTTASDTALGTVHDEVYLQFLQRASIGAARSGRELAASVYARGGGRRPAPGLGDVGFYGFDTTPITSGTWTATRAAASAALTAAELVATGEPVAYALCRPPGHHAGVASFGGYCYLNHAALVARRLAVDGRVAVVDIDYHHGNGTQQIFWEDGDVFFLSLHADPAWEYPLYWGYADETGAGDGAGCTRNVPLPAGVETAWYLDELGRALEAVVDFAPRWLVVSAGFDGYVDDPLCTFRLSLDGYAAIGTALARLQLPAVVLQEGGYCVDVLGELALTFLEPFA